jgi:cytosine/uracil/thiamine/allantoin permease
MTTGVGENPQGLPEDAPRAWRRWTRNAQNIAAILWPAFLAACIATAVFFGHVDPLDLDAISTPMTEFDSMTGYAIGFFFFWIICTISSLLSVFLISTSRRQNGKSSQDTHQ